MALGTEAVETEVVADRQVPEQARLLEGGAKPGRARLDGGSRVMSTPSRKSCPPVALSTPRTVFTSVVLPAPLRPTTATISPLDTARLTP